VTYTQPLLTILLATAAAALLGFPERIRRRLATSAVCGLFCVCWPPADWLFSRPLEARYPLRPFVPTLGLEALVVFSEGIDPPQSQRPYPVVSQNTDERCLYAAWIYHRHGPLPVLVSGGAPGTRLPAAALAMRDILLKNGIPESMLLTEELSKSTRENALRTAEILRQRGISRVALIVDARSMPRAAACLQKLGIEVVPAPSRFRQFGPLREELLPNWRAIRENEDTLHETLGLLWYLMRGWI
jgi:uncharacterized SAM-binding protein YcdF (DUF218 family)